MKKLDKKLDKKLAKAEAKARKKGIEARRIDDCDECGGKTGGHKPYCSKRFDGSSADPYKRNLAPTERDMALRSVRAAEQNASVRVLQLIVAGIACLAVVAGILWQVFG